MKFRKPLSLLSAVVTGTLLASAGLADDTAGTSHSATATSQECAELTGGNRTDCEKRAQERMSSSSSDSSMGAAASSSDHSTPDSRTDSAEHSDSAAYGGANSERTRVSQRDTDMSSDEGRGENKSPAPSANGTTMDWNQTNSADTSGSPAGETQRGPARADAPLTQDGSSDSERDNQSTASDGTDSE